MTLSRLWLVELKFCHQHAIVYAKLPRCLPQQLETGDEGALCLHQFSGRWNQSKSKADQLSHHLPSNHSGRFRSHRNICD